MNFLKPVMYLTGGILWLLFGAAFAMILWQFLAQGAGLQLFGNFVPAVSSGSVLFGFIYFVGFASASAVCFALGLFLLLKMRG